MRDNLILSTCHQNGLSCPDAIDATGIAGAVTLWNVRYDYQLDMQGSL